MNIKYEFDLKTSTLYYTNWIILAPNQSLQIPPMDDDIYWKTTLDFIGKSRGNHTYGSAQPKNILEGYSSIFYLGSSIFIRNFAYKDQAKVCENFK